MSDPHYGPDAAVPLTPDREYDQPSSPHMGRGAALRVPVSEGPATRSMDRDTFNETSLIEAEPPLAPTQFMEAGFEWTPAARRRVHQLDRPIRRRRHGFAPKRSTRH